MLSSTCLSIMVSLLLGLIVACVPIAPYHLAAEHRLPGGEIQQVRMFLFAELEQVVIASDVVFGDEVHYDHGLLLVIVGDSYLLPIGTVESQHVVGGVLCLLGVVEVDKVACHAARAFQSDDCLRPVELFEEPLRVPARSGVHPHRNHMTVRLLQFSGLDVGDVLIVQRRHEDLKARQLHKLLPVIRTAVTGVD